MNGMQQRPLGRGPKAVTCYICGRGYGTNSIGIHIKQCQKLFLAQEAQKPKHERRPLPQPPKDTDVTEEDLLNVRPGKANNVDWDKFNDAAFDTFNKEALVPCENCGRTFLPDSLVHHRNACKADKPTRRVGESVRADGGQTTSPALSGSAKAASSTRPKSAAKKVERRPNTASRAGASLALGGGPAKHQEPQQQSQEDGDSDPRQNHHIYSAREGNQSSSSSAHDSGLAILRSVVTDLKGRGVPDSSILDCVREALA